MDEVSIMPRRNKIVTAGAFLAAAAAVAGCSHSGSFDVEDSPGTKWNNLVALVQFKTPPQSPRPADPIHCPEIFVLEGTSADRTYKPGTEDGSENLRYQYSITDVARDCRVDGTQMSMKIGVQGKVLLGPAGSPGSFSVPIRVVTVRETDQSATISKLYHVPASVAAGQTDGMFTLVTEPLTLPYTLGQHDYTIKVGFDSAMEKKKKPEAQAQQASATPQQTAASDSNQPHRHHRRMSPDQTQ
jgi:hypothetical protein